MLKQIRQSLITRLIFYFMLAALAFFIFFGFSIAMGLKIHFKQEILPNVAQYLVYITQDIGSPPDLQTAQSLSDDLSFEIRIEGPGINWQTYERLPAISQLKLEPGPEPYQQFQFARFDEKNFVLFRYGDYEFLYGIGRLFKRREHGSNFVLIAFIAVVLAILFYLIRSSLKPIEKISAGIKEIGNGNLDSPIQVKHSTEFGRLAKGINDMAAHIQSMLQGKQQLLLAISHELRSPITRAKVNLELLQESQIREALIEDMNEMEALISQILESERLNQRHAELNKSDIRLDQLIEKNMQLFFAKAGIRSELNRITIHADKVRLTLLIKNLLDNAVKYSEDGKNSPIIRIYAKQQDVILEVEDSGCGMDAQEFEHIVQAFYRIDKARQRKTGGYGLGLYLSHLIVAAHQGKMEFESEPGQGTLVRVTLPTK